MHRLPCRIIGKPLHHTRKALRSSVQFFFGRLFSRRQFMKNQSLIWVLPRSPLWPVSFCRSFLLVSRIGAKEKVSLELQGDVAALVTYSDWLATPAKNTRPNSWNNDLGLKTTEAAYNTKQKQVMRAATLPEIVPCYCWSIWIYLFLYSHLGPNYQRFLEEMKDGSASVSEGVR